MGHSQPWGAGVQGAARSDSRVPCSKVASLRALASVGKAGDEVSAPVHIRGGVGWGGGKILLNQQHQTEQNCHLSR